MTISLSQFASTIQVENAFTVLAAARALKAKGKDVIELEIGDSPFPTTPAAKRAGIAAIEADETHYGPSAGLPELREAASAYINRHYGMATTAQHVVVAPGGKPLETLFCEAVLDPGDGVLVFAPYFPTYLPNLARRGARARLADLKQEHDFRPDAEEVARFLAEDPHPKAIFLNSPHNPTGGVATADDLRAIAELVRGRDVCVFSDEPYEHMVWRGQHQTIGAEEGLLEQTVAAYTFSKSYSMSGWRLGYAVTSTRLAKTLSNLINTSLSCVPPMVQRAGIAALADDADARDEMMLRFRERVERLVEGLQTIEGVRCLMPAGTFYAFPRVAAIANRLQITSHGLAMFLLEGADEQLGVACLGGESFGQAGGGFLRFSCAETPERLEQAVEFVREAVTREDRAAAYLNAHPEYRLAEPYPE